MARRRGKPGNYLMTSDYSDVTCYRTQLKKDYWGNYGEFNLIRNLQEIAKPLNDPYPVREFRGPSYEFTDACTFEVQPQFIGNTSVPFPTNAALNTVINFNPAIPDMEVGCTFIVKGDAPSPHTWDSGGFWDVPGASWD